MVRPELVKMDETWGVNMLSFIGFNMLLKIWQHMADK